MEIQTIIIIAQVISGICLFAIGLILWVNRKSILSFFWPHNYNRIIMLESDNNVSDWLQDKNSTLTFEFNDIRYRMYDKVLNPEVHEKVDAAGKPVEIEKDGKIMLMPPAPLTAAQKATVVYRSGRLGCFMYKEGNPDPIDFRTLEVKGNEQLTKQLEKIDILSFFTSSSFFGQNPWLLPLIAGLCLLLLIYIAIKTGQMPQNAVNAGAP